MADEKLKYRLSYFRTEDTIPLSWETIDDNIADKISPNLIYTTRAIVYETGKIIEKSYILVLPVKKFRKKETVISLNDIIDLGLDD